MSLYVAFLTDPAAASGPKSESVFTGTFSAQNEELIID
jgi:hypothetical protein